MSAIIKYADMYLDGLKELPGKESHPLIQEIIKSCMGWLQLEKIDDSAIAWCGCSMYYLMKKCRVPDVDCVTMPWRAQDWLNFGVPIDVPVYGITVVVMQRGGFDSVLGHVGVFTRFDETGERVRVYSGNQSNEFNRSWYMKESNRYRVLGYRLIPGYEEEYYNATGIKIQ